MLSNLRQACRPAQNPGEQDVLSLVSLASREEELTGLAREPLETCAVAAACLPPLRPGGAGTARSTSTRRGK